jgi:hypothetical protein
MSLAFHIIFAVIGMALPLLMAVSEGCYHRLIRRRYIASDEGVSMCPRLAQVGNGIGLRELWTDEEAKQV